MSQFIAGRWYKSNYHSNDEGNKSHWYYIKPKYNTSGTPTPDKLIGECLRFGNTTDDFTYYKEDYWDAKNSMVQALKLGPMTDLSEIIPYLPKDHPDIPRMSNKQKQSLLELIKSI